jgi:DNA-binding transcriptional regulator PaaX
MHGRLNIAVGLGEGVAFLSEALARFAWQMLSGRPPAARELRNLGRTMEALEKRGLVARMENGAWELTTRGRARMNAGGAPEERWDRGWSGAWHCLVFDLPAQAHGLRLRLHRLLKTHRLGYLQQSVWISPDPLPDLASIMNGRTPGLGSMLTFRLLPNPGTTDAGIVAEAWDFPAVNEAYAAWQAHVRTVPSPRAKGASVLAFATWSRLEQSLWRRAVRLDPLLPRELVPTGYRGYDAWKERSQLSRNVTWSLGHTGKVVAKAFVST